MRIAWFCIPAHGHTNPTLGVVKELTAAGHQVYYFSFEMFREKIEQAGAEFIGCDGYDFEMEAKDNADRVGKDKVFATELLVSSTLALDEMTTEKVEEIEPDIIVSDSVAFWGKLVAMKHGLPYVSSTTTFAFNRYSAKYMKESPWDIAKMLFTMPRINKQIQRLREKGYPVKGILEIVQNDNDTNTIVYTSKYFQPAAETFSDRYHFIGPSIRPITEPALKTAEKTVYISMGTVNQNRAFYRNCIQALGQTEWQVIISMGTNTEHFDDLPENIQIHETVDQMAVLSIADAFITHCGMNSASEGLYFQVPLVLFPQTAEQGAVAKRTEELGAGVMLKSISEEDILDAVRKVLTNQAYKENAVRISDSFHACGGAGEARAFLEEIVLTERIRNYEQILDRVTLVMDQSADDPEAIDSIREDMQRLEKYYCSPEWKEDYDADAAGTLPADLKRGVLSQDGIDHALERFRELSEKKNHPWEEIPLSDYENHMSLQSVQQLQALNQAMKEQLGQHDAASVMILGIAGGNGLEHLDRKRYRPAFAVDINVEYLAEVKRRYPDLDGILECICLDLTTDADKLPHAELLIANLLVEYIGYDAFRSVVASVDPDCISCVIQIDEDDGFVSDSPYLHAFDRLEEIHHQIEKEVLTRSLDEIGYQFVTEKTYPLPNEKQLLRMDFQKRKGSGA